MANKKSSKDLEELVNEILENPGLVCVDFTYLYEMLKEKEKLEVYEFEIDDLKNLQDNLRDKISPILGKNIKKAFLYLQLKEGLTMGFLLKVVNELEDLLNIKLPYSAKIIKQNKTKAFILHI